MNRKELRKLIIVVSLIAALAIVVPMMSGCLPRAAAPPEAPPEVAPPEAVVPEAPAPDPYDEYVAALPEGCEPVPRECFEQAQDEGEFYKYCWGEWWPAELREGFAQEFGIKVIKDDYGDIDEMVTKFKLYPETAYDFTLPDTRGFYQLKGLGIPQEINHDWIPNVNKYLPEATKNAEYDPGYKYSVAMDMCITTYGYNAEYVDDPRIPSWSAFFEPDEKYRGRITPLNNMYEVIGEALLYLGYSFNSDDEEELMEARDLLLRQKPYVMAYDSWPIREVLGEEDWMFQQWHGDVRFFRNEYKNPEAIQIAYPPEGCSTTIDVMVIPRGAPHPAAAHLFINYVFRPEVNALLIEEIGHSPNHIATAEFLSEELRSWHPPQEYLDKLVLINSKAYTGKGKELRSAIWEELKR